MSEMKGRLIDLNFLLYLNIIYKIVVMKHCFNLHMVKNSIILYVINMPYNIILNFKDLMILKYQTLSDLTAVNYPELFKSIELNYFFLSYKLNTKYSVKYYVNKEDLVLSLITVYKNANWLEREL